MIMEDCAHIVIQGLVQGVGFRYFACERANELGLHGFVCNMPTGDVEIEVVGLKSLINEFVAAIKIGPRSARIRDFQIQWKSVVPHYERFGIQ
jgi:acylphosphatase